MIRIRRAGPGDLTQIMELERASFSVPWSYQSFIFELESADAWFSVAEEDSCGRIDGFAVLHRIPPDGELFNIAVRETVRRNGIGDMLMEDIMRGAVLYGIERIFLEVRKSNAPARAMYLKHGFQVCGLRRNYYDAPLEDALVMEAMTGEKEGGDDAK